MPNLDHLPKLVVLNYFPVGFQISWGTFNKIVTYSLDRLDLTALPKIERCGGQIVELMKIIGNEKSKGNGSTRRMGNGVDAAGAYYGETAITGALWVPPNLISVNNSSSSSSSGANDLDINTLGGYNNSEIYEIAKEYTIAFLRVLPCFESPAQPTNSSSSSSSSSQI